MNFKLDLTFTEVFVATYYHLGPFSLQEYAIKQYCFHKVMALLNVAILAYREWLLFVFLVYNGNLQLNICRWLTFWRSFSLYWIIIFSFSFVRHIQI